MLNSFFKYNRFLFFIFIAACSLIIYGSSCLLLPPTSKADDLSLLILNKDTAPVFNMTSQLTYSSKNISEWQDMLAGNTKEPLDQQLNLLIELGDSEDFSTLLENLTQLSPYFSHISLSVLPSQDMTDETYSAQLQGIFDTLNPSIDFSLIAYPPTSNKLSLYKSSFITSVGTVLKTEGDLVSFEKVYKYFVGTKPLVVRDDIKRFYSDETSISASEITKLYYLLAIKYPGVNTIFSPYIISSYKLTDDYALNRSDSEYYLFHTIYNRLLEKPWITDNPNETVSAVSPYINLNSYEKLNGECEIILAPDSKLTYEIESYKSEKGNTPYLSFKCNNEYLSVTSYYPYSMILNASDLPNGASRLTAVLQDNNLELLSAYSMDLTINHPVSVQRAERIPTNSVTVTSSEPGKYEKDYIPILMYHTVTDVVSAEEQNSCVETKVFEKQMKGLLDAGYTPINFYDLKQHVNGLAALPEKPVIITMDDGYLNNYTHAYPIYKKYGIQATLFISPYYVQEENTDRHFGWKAAREMEKSGLIDIQAHGYDHTPLPYLSLKDVKYHITLAQGLIEMNLGPRDVSVVAYPQFRNTKYTRKILSDLDVDFQITKLAEKGTLLTPTSLKRINVPNTMSSDELIATLNSLTS